MDVYSTIKYYLKVKPISNITLATHVLLHGSLLIAITVSMMEEKTQNIKPLGKSYKAPCQTTLMEIFAKIFNC